MSSRKIDNLFFGMNENSRVNCLFTPFSLVHLISGFYMALVFNYMGLTNLQSFISVNIIHLLYEMKDYYMMYHNGNVEPEGAYHNTLMNSIGDHISAVIGALIFYYIINNHRITKREVIYATNIFIIITIIAWTVAWGYFKIG
jgi:hypothetical protein